MSRIKRHFKSLAILLIATLFIGMAGTTAVQAAKKKQSINDNNSISTYGDAYISTNDNMLGIAADFGLFVKENCRVKQHVQSNLAVKNLYIEPDNSGITNTGTYSYINKLTNEHKTGTGFSNPSFNLILGQDNTVDINATNVNINGFCYGTTHIINASYEKSLGSFIDLEKQFKQLELLSAQLYTLEDMNAILMDKDNNQWNPYITCQGNDTLCVLSIDAGKLESNTANSLDVQIHSDIVKNRILIINVMNMDSIGDELTIRKQLLIDDKVQGKEQTTGRYGSYDKCSSNVIWNFGDYQGTIKVATSGKAKGVFLAPKASVILGDQQSYGNYDGIIIAKNFINPSFEVHFIPFGNFTLPTPGSVNVFIETVNGDNCPSTPINGGGKYALFEKVGSTYQKVANSTKKASNITTDDGDTTFIAEWIIDKEGEFYIQQVKKEKNFTQTPVKCKFHVSKENGVLVLYRDKGKEVNGESERLHEIVIDGVKKEGFKLRSYWNYYFVAAVTKDGLKTIKQGSYSLYECSKDDVGNGTHGNLVTTKKVNANGYVLFTLPSLGYYCVIQETTADGYVVDNTPKYFVAYSTPVGHMIPIEFEDIDFGRQYASLLWSNKNQFQIQKMTKKIIKGIDTLEQNTYYLDLTDGWTFYINEKVSQPK